MRLVHVGPVHPHAPLYRDTIANHPAFDLVATVATAPARAGDAPAAGEAHVPSYSRLEQAIAAARPEAALITLPNDVMPAGIITAARLGLPILAEKPGARTAAEFRPVIAAIAEAGVPFGSAYLRRYAPLVLALRDLIADGILGDLQTAQASLITRDAPLRNRTYLAGGAIEHVPDDSGQQHGHVPLATHWMFDPARSGGGIMHWLGVHLVDLLHVVTGSGFSHATATFGNPNAPMIRVEESATAILEATSGLVATITCAYALPNGPDQIQVAIQGTRGWVTWDGVGDTMRVASSDPSWAAEPIRDLSYPMPDRPGYGGALGWAMFDRLRQASAGAAPLPAGPLDTWRVLAVLDAVRTAATTGHRTRIEEVG
jgi:predicted dehydrogenase